VASFPIPGVRSLRQVKNKGEESFDNVANFLKKCTQMLHFTLRKKFGKFSGESI